MATWKVVLIVTVTAILLMAIGMWLGYRYISEQDDIHPKGLNNPSNPESLIRHAHLPNENSAEVILPYFLHRSSLYS